MRTPEEQERYLARGRFGDGADGKPVPNRALRWMAPYGYGYSVEKYRWNESGLKVHIWANPSMDMRFDVPLLELKRVTSQSWLAGNSAILIGLDCARNLKSYSPDAELWLLYDFERGELHTCGDADWLVWPRDSRKPRRMPCGELRALAKNLK